MLAIESGIASLRVDQLIKNGVRVGLMTCSENGHFEAHLLALAEALDGVRPYVDARLDARLLLVG